MVIEFILCTSPQVSTTDLLEMWWFLWERPHLYSMSLFTKVCNGIFVLWTNTLFYHRLLGFYRVRFLLVLVGCGIISKEPLSQFIVVSFLVHQFLMCAQLQHLPAVHHHDLIRLLNGLQSMSNHKQGLAGAAGQGLLNLYNNKHAIHILIVALKETFHTFEFIFDCHILPFVHFQCLKSWSLHPVWAPEVVWSELWR